MRAPAPNERTSGNRATARLRSGFMLNANPAIGEDVLAALPTRANPSLGSGSDHTTFFNLQSADAVRAVSHKVWAARSFMNSNETFYDVQVRAREWIVMTRRLVFK